MKKIIITGCNGQLGRAMNKVLDGNSGYELVNTDVAELDITDIDAVLAFVERIQPYAIVNCAAYTAVDACEVNRELAYKINAVGPRNLAIAAEKYNAKLIHVSTDYVFAGNGTAPYTEFDAVGPKSMYGFTKLAGENFVKDFSKHYFIVRTAWLYGDGKNFLKTMLRLSETHDEITVVDDQIGSPTSAMELARAISWLIPTEENVHKECVKVYRNVQAVVVEENEKQTEAIAAKVKENLGGKLNGVLGVSIAAVVLTVADIVLHVLSILHIF